jgi:hypothetical protein
MKLLFYFELIGLFITAMALFILILENYHYISTRIRYIGRLIRYIFDRKYRMYCDMKYDLKMRLRVERSTK